MELLGFGGLRGFLAALAPAGVDVGALAPDKREGGWFE